MKKRLFVIFLFLYMVSFVIILNFKTPLIGEDIALSLPYSHRNERIDLKIPEIANKIYYQMKLWNVRIGEQIAIFFLSFDKSGFNIINTIMFFLFCFLIIVYSLGDFPSLRNISTYLWMTLIAALIFIFIPVLGEIFFWLDGASNYLWSINLLLLYFLPYRFLLAGKNLFENKPLVIQGIFYLLGIPIGLSNENTVPTIIFFIVAIYIYNLVNKNRSLFQMPTWYFPSVVTLLLGYLFLILAPSTHIRQAYYNEAFGVGQITVMTYIERAQNLVIRYFQISKTLLLVLCISFVIFTLYIWIIRKNISAAFIKNSIVLSGLLVFSFSSIIALVMSPYFEPRASLITWFFILTFIFYVFHLVYKSPVKNAVIVVSLVMIFYCMYQSHNVFNLYNAFYDEAEARHYQIISQMEQGKQIIEVTPFETPNSRWLNTRDDYLVFTATTHYPSYYGVKEIQFVDNKP